MKPTTDAGREPTTEAGRAAYNLVREPLIYGVRDRLDGNYSIAWAVRDGIVAAEQEAVTRVRTAIMQRLLDDDDHFSGCGGWGCQDERRLDWQFVTEVVKDVTAALIEQHRPKGGPG